MTSHKMKLLRGLFAGCALLALAACSTPEERAKAHYESGKVLLEAGDTIKASLEFRNAVKLNDKLVDAWLGIASVEEKRQNWSAVSDSLSRVIEIDAKNFDATFRLAKLQLAAIQLDKSLKNANIANELKPDNSDVAALRAAIMLRIGDKEGAIREAERALSLNPNNPDALAVLAAEQIAAGKETAALAFVQRGLQADPKNVGLLLFQARIYEVLGNTEKLEKSLRDLISYYPKQKEFRQSLLQFLLAKGREADVEKELRNYISNEPADTSAGLDLVRLVGFLRGKDVAKKELETLIAGHPDQILYVFAMARFEFSDNLIEAAEKRLAAVIEKGEPKGNVHQAKMMLAEFARSKGRAADATALVNEVIAQDPKNAEALAFRAKDKIDANDLTGAVIDLRDALDQKPDAVPTMILLARAYD